METKITKKVTHDNISLSAQLPSGAKIKFFVGRSGEKLELAFSNDREMLKQQMSEMTKWLNNREGEVNQSRFDRLEKVLRMSKSGAEVMNNLKNI